MVEESVRKSLADHSDFSKSVFPEKGDLSTLLSTVTNGSLFSSNTIILAKNPWFLSAALQDSDFARLQEICAAVQANGHVLLLYCPGKKVDMRKKFNQYLKKNAAITELRSFSDWEQDKVFTWIRTQIRQADKTIDEGAVTALEEIGGSNLSVLAKQIDTLLAFIGLEKHISTQHVHALAADKNASIFAFNDAIKTRNMSALLTVAMGLLRNGGDPVMMLGLIGSSIRLYLQMILHASEKKSYQEIAKNLGKNPYYIKRLLPEVQRHYTLQDLRAILAKLCEMDFAIKTGRVQARRGVELVLIHLSR